MKPWLYFKTFYKLSPYYKMEMNGRTKGSLKFVDEIMQIDKEDKNNNNNDGDKTYKSAIELLVNSTNNFTDQEIKEEIITLLVAVKTIYF
jgi:cytochrome P450